MKLKIWQVGESILRQRARLLTGEEIRSSAIQDLVDSMRDTMRDAPGVGLAAPQVGVPLQLAVIEDSETSIQKLSAEQIEERQRKPVDFHVIINPRMILEPDEPVLFFEGCLSLTGCVAIVPRAKRVRVECLNERAEPVTIHAEGWYARILQHEIDHLNGSLYIDRMNPRSFSTQANFERHWKDRPVSEVLKEFDVAAGSFRA